MYELRAACESDGERFPDAFDQEPAEIAVQLPGDHRHLQSCNKTGCETLNESYKEDKS